MKLGTDDRYPSLRAGEDIVLSTGGLNYSKTFWGPDAHEFK